MSHFQCLNYRLTCLRTNTSGNNSCQGSPLLVPPYTMMYQLLLNCNFLTILPAGTIKSSDTPSTIFWPFCISSDTILRIQLSLSDYKFSSNSNLRRDIIYLRTQGLRDLNDTNNGQPRMWSLLVANAICIVTWCLLSVRWIRSRQNIQIHFMT